MKIACVAGVILTNVRERSQSREEKWHVSALTRASYSRSFRAPATKATAV